ncbi:isocitrate/isopropylmalate dehydrogenase family protein [Candidatus Woesearchaeota archaeon]|nr:isocitrate/isopropylmalate dehydrogenase family protein [Candidatus Woesearchaeota archaeon]
MQKHYNIAILPGDGIGVEVVQQGCRVLEKAAENSGFKVTLHQTPWSSQYLIDEKHVVKDGSGLYVPNRESPLAASDNKGLTLPEEFIAGLRQNDDAMLFGSIGDPRVQRGVVERAIIGGLRWHPTLDLYVNLRPVKLYDEEMCILKRVTPKDLDVIVVRENLEDCYTSKGEIHYRGEPEEYAVRSVIASRRGTERIIRYAFQYAREHGRKTVTLVDKANVMNGDIGLIWRETFERVKQEYGDIRTNAKYIDDACAELATNPSSFDIIVTSNLFGDIVSDIASGLTGARGMAGSGNIHPRQFSVFEPTHGTAPDLKPGEANPLGTIFAVALMLDHLGQSSSVMSINRAVQSLFDTKVFTAETFRRGSQGKQSSTEITNRVLEQMN